MLLNYFDAHFPYDPPPPFDRYAKANPEIEVPGLSILLSGSQPGPDVLTKMLDLYDGEIEYMDHHVGRLFDALQEMGRYEDALIVVIADHGELFGEHGSSGHGAWLWEELVRVPLLVHYPDGRGAGTRDKSTVSTVDVMKWISDEVGFELPTAIDGVAVGERNLALAEEFPNPALIKLAGEQIDRDLVSGIAWPWKWIAASDGTSALFHIGDDPAEATPRGDETQHDRIASEVTRARESLVPPSNMASDRAMSPEATEQLRALGYLE